jgi:hypothetical protein
MKKKLKKLVNDFSLGELRTGLKVTSKEFVNKKLQFNSLRRGRPFHLDLEDYMPFVVTQMGKSAA